ncbi:MAG: polysaccharide pyruvyl transferase family protein, partial [Caldisericia bacterium]|nr:polysaccharide pyruvyl transferase family protein [Caldisericia bacterium]
MEKILLGGYFGFENIGDEAILLSQINFLKNEDFEPIVLTNKGIKVFDTESLNRYNFLKIVLLRKKFNIFILGGGGLFQDRTSFRSLLYYIFLIYFIKFLRKKVILLNIGIGPIIRGISKRLLINAIKMCDLIILRDKYSYDFLPELKNKFLSSDSTFIISFNKKEKEKLILLSLRNFKEIELEKFKKFIEAIKKEFDLNIEFVCFSPDEIKISEYLNLKYFYSKNPLDIIEKISKSDFLIGTRYHSIIFSIITETPFIGVVYD